MSSQVVPCVGGSELEVSLFSSSEIKKETRPNSSPFPLTGRRGHDLSGSCHTPSPILPRGARDDPRSVGVLLQPPTDPVLTGAAAQPQCPTSTPTTLGTSASLWVAKNLDIVDSSQIPKPQEFVMHTAAPLELLKSCSSHNSAPPFSWRWDNSQSVSPDSAKTAVIMRAVTVLVAPSSTRRYLPWLQRAWIWDQSQMTPIPYDSALWPLQMTPPVTSRELCNLSLLGEFSRGSTKCTKLCTWPGVPLHKQCSLMALRSVEKGPFQYSISTLLWHRSQWSLTWVVP